MLTEYFVEHPFPLALGNVKSPDTPSLGMLILIKMSLHKAGERQPRSPGQIGEHGPPVPLDSHADGHTKVYFLIAINEGIASELLARNRRRISVSMARVACMHVTVPADGCY